MGGLRLALAVPGLVATGYGALLLLDLGWQNLLAAVVWLAGGVLLHDAVLAPITVAVGAAGARWLPARWRAASAGGLVVLGSVTLLAVPVLGRFGARADNPTLLDRPYGAGWLLFAGVVALGVILRALLPRGAWDVRPVGGGNGGGSGGSSGRLDTDGAGSPGCPDERRD